MEMGLHNRKTPGKARIHHDHTEVQTSAGHVIARYSGKLAVEWLKTQVAINRN